MQKLQPSTYGFEMRGLTYEAELDCQTFGLERERQSADSAPVSKEVSHGMQVLKQVSACLMRELRGRDGSLDSRMKAVQICRAVVEGTLSSDP